MSDSVPLSRRQMLMGTALAGAAATTANAAGRDGADPAAASPDPRAVILHDTPHTRTYYALARD